MVELQEVIKERGETIDKLEEKLSKAEARHTREKNTLESTVAKIKEVMETKGADRKKLLAQITELETKVRTLDGGNKKLIDSEYPHHLHHCYHHQQYQSFVIIAINIFTIIIFIAIIVIIATIIVIIIIIFVIILSLLILLTLSSLLSPIMIIIIVICLRKFKCKRAQEIKNQFIFLYSHIYFNL